MSTKDSVKKGVIKCSVKNHKRFKSIAFNAEVLMEDLMDTLIEDTSDTHFKKLIKKTSDN